jgi:hypothetical protein
MLAIDNIINERSEKNLCLLKQQEAIHTNVQTGKHKKLALGRNILDRHYQSILTGWHSTYDSYLFSKVVSPVSSNKTALSLTILSLLTYCLNEQF